MIITVDSTINGCNKLIINNLYSSKNLISNRVSLECTNEILRKKTSIIFVAKHI